MQDRSEQSKCLVSFPIPDQCVKCIGDFNCQDLYLAPFAADMTYTMPCRLLVGAKVSYKMTCSNLVTGDSGSGEGDDHSSELVADLPQHFPPPGDKVAVVFRVDSHRLLDNVVLELRQRESIDVKNGCKSVLAD